MELLVVVGVSLWYCDTYSIYGIYIHVCTVEPLYIYSCI